MDRINDLGDGTLRIAIIESIISPHTQNRSKIMTYMSEAEVPRGVELQGKRTLVLHFVVAFIKIVVRVRGYFDIGAEFNLWVINGAFATKTADAIMTAFELNPEIEPLHANDLRGLPNLRLLGALEGPDLAHLLIEGGRLRVDRLELALFYVALGQRDVYIDLVQAEHPSLQASESIMLRKDNVRVEKYEKDL